MYTMIIRLNRQKSTIPSFPDPNITIIFIHILIIFTLIFLTIMIIIISEADLLTDTMTLVQIHRQKRIICLKRMLEAALSTEIYSFRDY